MRAERAARAQEGRELCVVSQGAVDGLFLAAHDVPPYWIAPKTARITLRRRREDRMCSAVMVTVAIRPVPRSSCRTADSGMPVLASTAAVTTRTMTTAASAPPSRRWEERFVVRYVLRGR